MLDSRSLPMSCIVCVVACFAVVVLVSLHRSLADMVLLESAPLLTPMTASAVSLPARESSRLVDQLSDWEPRAHSACTTHGFEAPRVLAVDITPSAIRGDAWLVQVTLNATSSSSSSDAQACEDFYVPPSFYNNVSIVPSTLQKHVGTGHLVFSAHLPCAALYRVYFVPAWRNWMLASPSRGPLGTCAAPELEANLLPHFVVETPVCAPALVGLGECARPQDLFSAGRWRASPALIEASTASLVNVNNLTTPWGFLRVGQVAWEAFACRWTPPASVRDVHAALANKIIVVVGDSLAQEIFMSLVNLVELGAWSRERNKYANHPRLSRVREGYRLRMFDTSFAPPLNLTLRFLWAGHADVGVNGQGVLVARDAAWLASLDAFTNGSSLIVADGALHDSVLYSRPGSVFTFDNDVEVMLRVLQSRAPRVWWLSTPYTYRRKYACADLGNPGIALFNARARRAVERLNDDAVTWIDSAAMGFGAALHGDGRHCVKDYAMPWRQFGLSCMWRVAALVEAMRIALAAAV